MATPFVTELLCDESELRHSLRIRLPDAPRPRMSRGFAIDVPPLAQLAPATITSGVGGAAARDHEGYARRVFHNSKRSGNGKTCDAVGRRAPVRHLIPLMDTFNHDNSARSSVQFVDDETGSGEFVLTTHNDWEVGDEVFIHYGHFTPAEFLTGYGFVPKAGNSLNDSHSGSMRDGRPMIDISGHEPSAQHVAIGGMCRSTSTCTKLKSSLVSALGSHALELTTPSCLVGLANRSALEDIIGAAQHVPLGSNMQKSLAATAAATAIKVGESHDGDFESFVLDMIASELQGRLNSYASTLEQDEHELRKRSRRQQQDEKDTTEGAHHTVGKDAQAATSRDGLSIDALLSLFVGEKRLLRECEHKIAQTLMRARLKRIGIT